MLEFMYITNNPQIAQMIDGIGVDRVWIDLEVLGKEERQKNQDTVKSNHTIEDIEKIRPLLKHAKLQVRINPINDDSDIEINRVLNAGCDYIMLPMYKTVREVRQFLELVAGRTKTILLLETKEAVSIIDEVLNIPGIDEIHIGLNDLHLSMKKKFMFELLADGTVECICRKIKSKNIPYGFGGIARIGQGLLPAEYIIAEHYRLGSTRAILSRSFCDFERVRDFERFYEQFCDAFCKIKEYENRIIKEDETFFEKNMKEIKKRVSDIVLEDER